MKRIFLRIFIVTIFVLCAGNAVSQSRFYRLVGDTVCGRSPIYYYDWWPDQDSIGRAVADSIVAVNYQVQYYMRHFTSSPLTIIGIASTLSLTNMGDFSHPYEDYNPTYDTTQYYILYDATPTGPVEIARVCWSDDYMTHPKRYMVLPYTHSPSMKPCENLFKDTVIAPLREYYFDAPITIEDSFYLGYDYRHRDMDGLDGPYAAQIINYIGTHMRLKGALWGEIEGPDSCYLVPPQLFYQPIHQGNTTERWGYFNEYLLVFPIIEIDTTLLMPCESKPGTPTVAYRDEERVRVEWVDSFNFEWIVSVTTQGGSPESGRMIPSTQPFIDLYGLDGDSAYSVYVKGHCHGEIWSEWSPSCTIPPLSEESIAEPETVHFSLNPNPAKGTVTLSTAAQQGTVTVVDMQGREVVSTPHTGTETVIDLKKLAAGIYVVRLNTPQGVSTQKLTVE